MTKTISVFGSSMVEPGSDDYQDALAVGVALAEAGYTVMTGGYGGIMEAASRGANEAGGQVLGVTSAQIEAIRPGINANRWVHRAIAHPRMSDRLDYLIRKADGYVVMPGGVGTLNELVLAWEYMRVDEITVRPLVCYGPHWQRVLGAFMDERYLPRHHWDMIQFATTPAGVVQSLAAKGA